MDKKIRVYLASLIFAECWREYNEKIAQRIETAYPDIELYVPQRNKSINDKTKCASAEDIATGDFTNNLDKDDIMIAVVDGDTPGIGTTVECGYFARICEEEIQKYGSTKKKIISLYTDSRECSNTYLDAKNEKLHEFAECQYSYINLLLVGALKRYGVMCRTIDQVIEELGIAIKAYKDDDYDYCKCEEMEQSLKSLVCNKDCNECDGCQDEVEVELYNKAQEAILDYLDYKSVMLWKSKIDNLKSISDCDGEVFHYTGEVLNDR